MEMRRSRVPAFGDWNNSNEFNTSEYFDSIRDLCWIEEEHDRDRFYASSTMTPNIVSYQRKEKGNGQQKNCEKQQQVRKQRKMSGGAVKPVDEDLYKIPPELLYKKSKKKRMVRSLWSGCMRVSCVAKGLEMLGWLWDPLFIAFCFHGIYQYISTILLLFTSEFLAALLSVVLFLVNIYLRFLTVLLGLLRFEVPIKC